MSQERLHDLRDAIEALDAELVRLMGERRALVIEVGGIKRELGLPVMDPTREAAVVRRAATLARYQGGDEELVRDVIWRIMASARDEQKDRGRWGPAANPESGE
jgi:chorismate mutase/prephenate dehydrogenase